MAPVDSMCQEEGNQELTSALLQLGIGCVCYISSTTVKKSFYVDGHEREGFVENRKELCKQYLTELEPYCMRWIQVSREDASTIDD
jgi:hypothetical protein